MKKLLITLAIGLLASTVDAQFQLNPQIGVTFQQLRDLPAGYDTKANVGWQLGTDARIGNRFFVQPGVFLSRSVTAIRRTAQFENGTTSTTEVEDNLVNTNLKLRAQLGYRIIDNYQFDLRFMLGTSYDVLMSVNDRHDRLDWNKGDFNKGSWNIDAGLGFDMGVVTVSPTASFGLSRVFEDNPSVSQINSKYMTYGLTIGFNIGDDDKND